MGSARGTESPGVAPCVSVNVCLASEPPPSKPTHLHTHTLTHSKKKKKKKHETNCLRLLNDAGSCVCKLLYANEPHYHGH